MKQTFEQFLQEQHGKGYMGTDDDMPEAYEHWTDTMDIADVMDWAEIYGRTQFTAGKQFMLDEIKNIEKKPDEQYKCQSYIENGKLIDCTCGKCF